MRGEPAKAFGQTACADPELGRNVGGAGRDGSLLGDQPLGFAHVMRRRGARSGSKVQLVAVGPVAQEFEAERLLNPPLDQHISDAVVSRIE